MIATLLIIALAFVWLLKETDYMRVRLESTEYQKTQLAQADTLQTKRDWGSMPMNRIDKQSDTDITPLKPLDFTPLDMPDLTGSRNIICERG